MSGPDERIAMDDARRPPFDWQDHRIARRFGRALGLEGLGLYQLLTNYRNADNECWPSLATLCDQVGTSENTLKKYLRILQDLGLIRMRPALLRRGTKAWHGYIFTLLDVPDASYESPSKFDGDQILTPIKKAAATPSNFDPNLDLGELDLTSVTDMARAREAPAATDLPPDPPSAMPPDPLAVAFAPPDPTLHEVALSVLAYLNDVTGRQYGSPDPEPALRGIKDRLRAGATHADCFLVIDFCQAVLDVEQPGYADRRLNTQTPWKPDLFDTYLNRARDWHARGRPPASPPRIRAVTRHRWAPVPPAEENVLSHPRTAANVRAAQRGLDRMLAAWGNTAGGAR